MADIVSYNAKHNEANGENNRDGTDDNRSWNCGAEGVTEDPAVLALRKRQVRNLLATLLLSLGVPMLLGGDEIGRTQVGNNNAYCQDNEVSWYDWDNQSSDVLAWARALVQMRRVHPVFRRRRFFQDRPLRQVGASPAEAEVGWFRPDGVPMTDADWAGGYAQSLAMLLNGSSPSEPDLHGRLIPDASFYLALNAWEQPLGFRLPDQKWGGPWHVVLDTCDDRPAYKPAIIEASSTVLLVGHHFVVLQQTTEV
jgi:isoamylase